MCELGWIHKVTNNLGLLQVLPSFPVTSLNTVLAQGMNLKKNMKWVIEIQSVNIFSSSILFLSIPTVRKTVICGSWIF